MKRKSSKRYKNIMLSKRFCHNGQTINRLDELQKDMKKQVDLKIEKKKYVFEDIPCFICGSKNDFRAISETDRYGLYMPVKVCKKCGLIQTNPRMTQESYNEFYNCEYRELYSGTKYPIDDFFKIEYSHGKRIYEYLVKNKIITSEDKKHSILEVGCGAGGILKYFQEKGFNIYGVDIGSKYIEYGRNNFKLNLEVGDISSVDSNYHPDIIIYADVLEHILDINKEFESVRKLAKDKTLVYIGLPGVKNLWNSYNKDFLQLMQNAHVYHFTLDSLVNAMKVNGFQLLIGNEEIIAVFSKETSDSAAKELDNDYFIVVKFIRQIETYWKLRNYPRRAIVWFFRVIGVYKYLKIFIDRIRAMKK